MKCSLLLCSYRDGDVITRGINKLRYNTRFFI
jgi:hypothetical protein